MSAMAPRRKCKRDWGDLFRVGRSDSCGVPGLDSSSPWYAFTAGPLTAGTKAALSRPEAVLARLLLEPMQAAFGGLTTRSFVFRRGSEKETIDRTTFCLDALVLRMDRGLSALCLG